jgi:hypothetical protein
MRRRGRRWALLIAPLLVLAILWAQPTQAFVAQIGARSVNASIVAPSSAYIGESLGACTGSHLLTLSCTLTITNKGTTSMAFAVALDADSTPPLYLSITGSPTASIAAGNSGSVTLNFKACGVTCVPGSYPIWFNVTATNSHVIDTLQGHYQVNMTLT